MSLYSGLWTLAARDGVFLLLAVHGFVKWGQKR